jgi:hypothetical protein
MSEVLNPQAIKRLQYLQASEIWSAHNDEDVDGNFLGCDVV